MRILISLSIITLLLATGCKQDPYTATATIQLVKSPPAAISSEANQLTMPGPRIEAAVAALESTSILQEVIDMLESSNQATRFMSPYEKEATSENLSEILEKNRAVDSSELSLQIYISYAHPDPEIAALVANTFAREFIDFTLKQGIEKAMENVEDLRARTDQQNSRIAEIEHRITEATLAGEDTQSLEHDLKVQSDFYKALISRMDHARMSLKVGSTARIVDLATAPEK